MGRDHDAALRRTGILNQDIIARTGDSHWNVTTGSVPSGNPRNARVIRISHPLMLTTADPHEFSAARDFLATDRPTPAASAAVDELIRRVAHRSATRSPGGQPWKPEHTFCHPLVASLLIRINGERTRRPREASGLAAPGSMDIIFGSGIETGNGMLVDSVPWSTGLEIPEPIPETLAAAAAGRPLTEVVDVQPSGHDDVDGAVERLTIREIAVHPNGTRIEIAPADWIIYGQPLVRGAQTPYSAAANSDPKNRWA